MADSFQIPFAECCYLKSHEVDETKPSEDDLPDEEKALGRLNSFQRWIEIEPCLLKHYADTMWNYASDTPDGSWSLAANIIYKTIEDIYIYI